MVIKKPKHILIAPLDWGLGHTTRCVPIIRHILKLGHIPVIAGNGTQRSFINEIFGPIDFIHLDGYNITYSKWNKWAQIGLLSQLPGINKTIVAEHDWLLQLCNQRPIDGIISDNRYGLFHEQIPSVIITHQLHVLSGLGTLADRVIQKIHYKYLNRFQATWVPDVPGVPNLSGRLGHTENAPRHMQYIGLLSRFEGPASTHLTTAGTQDSLVVLLSGPEPQRTDLSQLMWHQLKNYSGRVVFVEGSEEALAPKTIPANISYHKRIAGPQLATILQDAAMIICRSGYSTLMDLVAINKKAILIPTPGQTEQEYLGMYLHKQGIFYCAGQKGFDINTALNKAQQFLYHAALLQNTFPIHQKVIEAWLQTL